MSKEKLSQVDLYRASNVLHESLRLNATFPLSTQDVGNARYLIERRRVSQFKEQKVGIFPTTNKLQLEDYVAALEVWNDLYDQGDVTQPDFAKYSKPPAAAIQGAVRKLTGEIWKAPDLENE